MFDVDLALPFTLGLVAAFNPCGFAMLPVYVSFFMGKDTDDDANIARNILRALAVGGVLTLGFVAVFGAFGLLTSSLLSSGAILDRTPYVTFGLGLLLVPFGIAMLAGFEPKINVPRMQKGGKTGELGQMFLFGVSYAVVSLGCTVGLFITNVSNSFNSAGFVDGLATFVAYGLGMGAVIMVLTLAMAVGRTSVAKNMRRILPWVNRISGVLLVLSGIYLAIYGWWEIQVLRGNIQQNALVRFFEEFQGEVLTWITETGAPRFGIGLLIVVGAALLYALWGRLTTTTRMAALGGLGALYLLLEVFPGALNIESWGRFDLIILPVVRTIVSIPERIDNWFSDPIRWGVLGELIVLAIIALTVWFRLRRMVRKQDTLEVRPFDTLSETSKGPAAELATDADQPTTVG